MNEKPLEWMTVYGESAGHKAGRIASLAALVAFGLFFILSFQLFALIGAGIFGILFAWLQLHAFVEYEFCYFADELDVAVIYNRARRKKKFACTMDEVEYMVKRTEQKENTLYLCDRKNVSSIYSMVLNKEGKRTSLVMEPAPEFLEAMKMRRKLQ